MRSERVKGPRRTQLPGLGASDSLAVRIGPILDPCGFTRLGRSAPSRNGIVSMAAKKATQGKGKGSSPENPNDRLIARNRKARYDFEILETFEAGMVLMGTEVKSLRDGRVNLTDSYAEVRDGEVFLRNLHISPYTQGNRFNHEPLRARKLLLNRREIRKLIGKTAEKGLTLVALSLYFKRGKAKCELGLARGKKSYDKRASKANADAARKIQQALRGGMRRGGGDA